MQLSVQSICNLMARVGLLPAPEVRALYQQWNQEAGGAASDLERFRRWLLAHQHITEFQADRLFRGQTDRYVLNQYTLLDRIGLGRMAGVYKASHRLGQIVAIKVLPPSKAQDREAFARFHREARLAVKLQHPNVVRTYHTGESEGLYYLVMEYLDGETLKDVLKRRGKLPMIEAVHWLHQALQGLQYIHEQGLVHRDMTPSNLMLVPRPGATRPDDARQGIVKILDIGLGRVVFDEDAPRDVHNLTTDGSILGLPEYMAPEQARNASTVDIRADIYSLGCVLYEALVGQSPFADKNAVRQMLRHATEPPAPLRHYDPSLPATLQPILDQMLAKVPDQRFATPKRAAQALEVFLAADDRTRRQEKADAKMQAYLQWLETNAHASAAPPSAPVSTPTAAPPRAPSPPVASPAAAAAPAPVTVASSSKPAAPTSTPAPATSASALSVQNMCNQMSKLQLLPPDQIRNLFQRWQREAGAAAGDPTSFGKWLVAQRCLTDYQAAILTGRRQERLRFGAYKVLSRIGQGRLAGIYKAATPNGQIVAIKTLSPAKAADPNTLARFHREARLAMRLTHPNTIRTFQAGEDAGIHYLVMEYLEGDTLKDVLLQQGRLPAAEAIRLTYQALQGLQHLHELGIVHRDIEPGNLLLVGSGLSTASTPTPPLPTLKILDIGVGRAMFDDGAAGVADAVTVAGDQLGTAEYRSPEQSRDPHQADIRSDLYSLGCVFYHCLIGEPPFAEKNLVRLLMRHATESPTPLSKYNVAAPAGLQHVLDMMLAKDPALRYGTPGEAIRDLRGFLTS